MKKTCVILLSHANTDEKDEILYQSILSIKKLNLPIILVSHYPISNRNQSLCDYSLYEKNNVIFKETDFFNYDLPISESNFNLQWFFGGISTRTYVQKQTYNGSVINLITNGVNIANLLEFDFGMLWEFDFIMNETSINSIIQILDEVKKNNYDCFYIPCKISGIDCSYSNPQIFPIKKLLDYNSQILQTPKDFIEITKFQICEQWMYNFYKTLNNPYTLSFNEYRTFFPDITDNLSSSGLENPLFWGINSGVFIDKNDKTNWIFSVYNSTKFEIDYSCEIFYDNEKIIQCKNKVRSEHWIYDTISKKITNEIINSNTFLYVHEKIIYNDVETNFQYKINKENLESISKAKVFFYL